MSTVQPQFDIVGAVATTTTAVSIAVINFGRIMKLCYKEDVQPLVIPPLERLGNWLMVDPSRLRQGEQGLENIPSPRLFSLASLSLLIGLDTDTNVSLVKIISCNNSLIASFLLLGGCATCFDTGEASLLMHELMRLNGTLKDYQIPTGPVRQFAEAINGYVKYMKQESATDVYTALVASISQLPDFQRTPLNDLDKKADIVQLARLVYEVIEKLQDSEVQLIVLKGIRQGVWLASLFVWLRPKEVEVLASSVRIYPRFDRRNSDGSHSIRLSIRLAEDRGNNHLDSSWNMESWTTTEDTVPIKFNVKDSGDSDFEAHHSLPLGTVRYHLSTRISEPAIEAIGHLTAALVKIGTEFGQLYNRDESAAQPLKDLCSLEFLSIYGGIVTYFGWSFDDQQRQRKTTEALEKSLRATSTEFWTKDTSKENILGNLIDTACSNYSKENGQSMLLSREDAQKGSSGEDTIIEHAIYLAGEALLFAFCAQIPGSRLYRPLEPFRFQENASLLHGLLRRTNMVNEKKRTGGYSFWNFRKRAMEALIPGTPDIQPFTDLAVAGNGQVVYSAALANWNGELTDRREVTTLHVAPGPLKAEKVEGKLSRLREDHQNTAIASRYLDITLDTIALYENDQWCLDERRASNQLSTKIVHLWRTDSMTSPQIMYMKSYIQVNRRTPGGRLILPAGEESDKVPTGWGMSIDALAFANHIEREFSTISQLQDLAKEWEKNNLLGANLRWCSVGRAVDYKVRWIATTSDNEQLRFFEAGNLSVDHKVYIRHRSVSLLECIRVAMNECGKQTVWVIIA
ncbi:hypothetical protein F5884DRAFT_834177 [Xylogone sp. PMI_703]|nr:hypothetical protein F5884DRAFT_834177 [Xylogone sp. PMI_703]